MKKLPKTALAVALLFGVELYREWVLLRALGFDSARFANWLKGE